LSFAYNVNYSQVLIGFFFLFQDTAEDKPSHQPILDPARDESSIGEPAPETSTVPFAVTFNIIEDSTSKGKPKLIDNRGYSYGIKRRRVNATDWVCTRRPKVNAISVAFNIVSKLSYLISQAVVNTTA